MSERHRIECSARHDEDIGAPGCICTKPRANPSATDDQLHPLARLDGDNAGGNPATFGLLDELLNCIERIGSIVCDAAPGYANRDPTLAAEYINAVGTKLLEITLDAKHQRSEIESQENTGR